MDLLRWMGVTFARFVGLMVLILGGWAATSFIWALFTEDSRTESLGLVALVVFMWLAGAVGGLFYLLSFDGPNRFRTQKTRMWGWIGMLAAGLVPTSLTLMILPLVAAVIPLLPWLRVRDEKPATSG
jgi:hypothetical protein